MSYILQTSHLSKTIDGKQLVTDVNIHVKKGEVYGFLGPNGAGKTTVMKMLTNLWKPTSGTAWLFGRGYEYEKNTVSRDFSDSELAEEVVRDYVQRNFVDKGICADWAIHDSENDKGQRNLHIHVLLLLWQLNINEFYAELIIPLM